MTAKNTPALKLLDTAAQIQAAIASIKNRGEKLQRDIHVCAVSCLMHADKHGDITLAVRLVDALPGMTRKNALLDWLQAFGKFSWDEQAKALKFAREKKTNREGAEATPFWEFKPEAEYKPFVLADELARLLSKAKKAQEKGDKRDVVPVGALALIAQALTAAKVPEVPEPAANADQAEEAQAA